MFNLASLKYEVKKDIAMSNFKSLKKSGKILDIVMSNFKSFKNDRKKMRHC